MYEYALSIPDMLQIGKWKHAHFETDFLHDVTPSQRPPDCTVLYNCVPIRAEPLCCA